MIEYWFRICKELDLIFNIKEKKKNKNKVGNFNFCFLVYILKF